MKPVKRIVFGDVYTSAVMADGITNSVWEYMWHEVRYKLRVQVVPVKEAVKLQVRRPR